MAEAEATMLKVAAGENGGSSPEPAGAGSRKTYEAYGIRWLILFMFVMYSTSNAFQWTQLVIITNILEKYYQVNIIRSSPRESILYLPLLLKSRSLHWRYHGLP